MKRESAIASLVIGANFLLLSACATAPAHKPANDRLSEITALEVVFSTPSSNFAYFGSSGAVAAVQVAPVRTSSEAATAALASAALGALETAATEHARMAMLPVGNTVSDIDVPRTFVAAVAEMRPAAGRTVRMTLSERSLPYPPSQPSTHASYAEMARGSAAEATLFVRLDPYFRGIEHSASIDADLALISRSGELLYADQVRLLGVAPGGRTNEELVLWWAEGRFRQFLLHGVRASALVFAQSLWSAPSTPEAVAQYAAVLAQLPTYAPEPLFDRKLFSDSCGLAPQAVNVRYRYVRTRRFVRAALRCDGAPDISSLGENPWQPEWRSPPFQ